jgi:signal transduction histidine kinase
MDPLTASVALAITQLCISAIMAGIHFSAPPERCTRYWAMSGMLTGIGTMIIMLNAVQPAKLLVAAGNIGLYAGCVLTWMGLKAFVGQAGTRWGYWLIALFTLLFLLLLANDSGFTARAYLSSASLILILSLCLRTLVPLLTTRSGRKRSVASAIAITGLSLIISMHLLRIVTSLQAPDLFRPATISSFGTIVIYLIPMAGTLLFFSALLLLYFERIKHQFVQSLNEKQDALESQIRFVDMFSHEYRTPLAVIRTNLDILQTKDQSSGERFASNLSKMRRAVLRLVEIAEAALTIGPAANGETELRRETIVMPEFLLTVIDEANILWSDQEPDLRLLHADMAVFNGDRKLLQTAFLNLFDNAIKYGKKGGTIEVALTEINNTLSITISDNGCGIAPLEIELVFKKYFRGSRSNTIAGTGLGLYLVQRIIAQHSGSIELCNRPSGGTLATITLPLI